MSNPIGRVAPNDPRLPPNLLLSEPVDAEILPDGRAVPVNLPPGARAFHYPDLPVEDGVRVPTFASDEPQTSSDDGQNTGQTPTAEAATTPDTTLPADETEPVTSAEAQEAIPDPEPSSPAETQEIPASAEE